MLREEVELRQEKDKLWSACEATAAAAATASAAAKTTGSSTEIMVDCGSVEVASRLSFAAQVELGIAPQQQPQGQAQTQPRPQPAEFVGREGRKGNGSLISTSASPPRQLSSCSHFLTNGRPSFPPPSPLSAMAATIPIAASSAGSAAAALARSRGAVAPESGSIVAGVSLDIASPPWGSFLRGSEDDDADGDGAILEGGMEEGTGRYNDSSSHDAMMDKNGPVIDVGGAVSAEPLPGQEGEKKDGLGGGMGDGGCTQTRARPHSNGVVTTRASGRGEGRAGRMSDKNRSSAAPLPSSADGGGVMKRSSKASVAEQAEGLGLGLRRGRGGGEREDDQSSGSELEGERWGLRDCGAVGVLSPNAEEEGWTDGQTMGDGGRKANHPKTLGDTTDGGDMASHGAPRHGGGTTGRKAGVMPGVDPLLAAASARGETAGLAGEGGGGGLSCDDGGGGGGGKVAEKSKSLLSQQALPGSRNRDGDASDASAATAAAAADVVSSETISDGDQTAWAGIVEEMP